nr:MAG TPA: hypothetical protein [Caudoviricetes sp.]
MFLSPHFVRSGVLCRPRDNLIFKHEDKAYI